MIKKNNMLKSPGGMRSFLPVVALELKNIEKEIVEVFRLWGYQPIITPTLEYFESLREGMGRTMDKKLYKFIDYEGNILSLRPEMTAPIARTLSTRLNDIQLPLRLSYNASVFRYDQPQTGKNREIYQLGVEFIGEKNYLADAEAIILAIESIQNTGLKDFRIDIGHAGFLNGIIEELELDEDIEFEIKTFLNKKDLVGLNNYIMEMNDSEREILKKIPLLRGSLEILDYADELVNNEKSIEAIKNLKTVYQYIEDHNLAEYITFDLGLIRGFDYYTGVVFEGFTEKLGYTICGGGRYDNLLKKYSGVKIPAIGFAIGIERVRLALKRQGYKAEQKAMDQLIIYNPGTESTALNTAHKLRHRGYVTVTIAAEDEEKKFIEDAKKKGLKRILFFKNSKELVIKDIKNNQETKVSLEKGWEDKLWQI
ncbi:MAG: ATP phosphoribosyltransferase regulatory subunit [Halanaerobiaceae bacterium]